MFKLRKSIMDMMQNRLLPICLTAMFVATGTIVGFADQALPDKPLDVPYEPTHPQVVEAMLRLGHAGPNDIHYDLGCGDGRVVIMGVKKFHTKHGHGFDINEQRLREANERAEIQGVTEKTDFVNKDIFNADFRDANLITAYLLDHINLKMRPILFHQLQPGSRVVTHEFHMHDWRPDIKGSHPFARGQAISYWVIPAPVGGEWEWSTATKDGSVKASMELTQLFQDINGNLTFEGGKAAAIGTPKMNGAAISFTTRGTVQGKAVAIKYQGIARGDSIRGVQVWSGGISGIFPWVAKRKAVTTLGRWNIDIPQKSMFNGTLNITKEALRLKAQFFSKDGNIQIGIHDVYLWGTSIYFRIPLSRSEFVIFKGELKNEGASGSALGKKAQEEYKEGIYDPETTTWTVPWTATRAK